MFSTRRIAGRDLLVVLLSCVALLASLTVGMPSAAAVPGGDSTVFINEIHYDNAGTDVGEAVEIAGPAGTGLDGWSLLLYNGSNGTLYNTTLLSGVLADQAGGYGFVVVNYPSNGLQNGGPDGIALVDPTNNIVQFLSYEASAFAATDGPIAGQVSTDIGVAEASTTPIGSSLQLTGDGTTSADFAWASAAASTFGASNNGQTFGGDGGGGGEPLPRALPLIEGFDIDDCTATGWQVVSLDADQANTWSCNAAFSNADVNGFGDDAPADEWLITPALDMDAQANEVLDFRSYTNFSDVAYPQLEVLYSMDYDGAGDPTAANWTALTGIIFSPEASGDYVDSGSIDLSTISGASVHFAFRYTSSGTGGGSAASWRLDDVAFTIDDDMPPAGPVRIHAIQGDGAAVAITGPVEVQAIVTSLFEDNDAVDGFFIQEEDVDADSDPQTSEGIFVYCRGGCPADLAVGNQVTVAGNAVDFFGMSQIDASPAATGSITIDSSGNALPAATVLSLPAPGRTDAEATFEATEAMIVSFADTLAVSEYFQLGRFGQLVLTDEARPEQFTDANEPSTDGYAAYLDDLATRRIILDDNNNDNNDRTTAPLDNEPYAYPVGGLSTTNLIRGGDTITGLTGVLHWSWAGSGGTDAWRVRPIDGQDYTFTTTAPRDATPDDVGGTVKVASFNVLNYFTTLDVGDAVCGPSLLGCRGADSAAELQRQKDKIVSAILAMDPDVLGIIEVENDDGASIADLVSGLNATAGAGTYDYIDTGTIGGDAIKVGLIYQPGAVTPVGEFAILDSSVDPTFIDDKNRPVLIQTFEDATEARFTVAVNHLKSKGSDCDDLGDPDANDGQANCNLTRTAAATALANYLATDPTGSGDDDFLIIGDINAYAKEDPITALTSAGYTDLVADFIGPDAYSYVFDGQLGYLDHALANDALLPQVTGVTTWHINADEVNLFDYNDDVRDEGEQSFERESNATDLYDPDAFRSSDHDPVLIGLSLTGGAEVYSCGGITGTANRLAAQGYNVLIGDDSRNVINGTSGDDFIVAGGGNDRVIGRGGNDVICGGAGDDVLIGGIGDDAVFGDSGDDILHGNSGVDVCNGGTEVRRDRANGGCETTVAVP